MSSASTSSSSPVADKTAVTETDPVEVSYTILTVGKENHEELLQKVATTINVQLALEGQSIPYIFFNGFERARLEDKLFIHGTSGCGKSRSIVEFVRDDLASFENIYVINPRNPLGKESGRVSLRTLLTNFTERDAVIWDNFPDDLIKRDIDNATNVLEIVSSRNVKRLLIALKPRYLELYRGIAENVPELYSHEITYDKDKIHEVVRSYGAKIPQFHDLYEKYLANDADKVSRILWRKEPIPIAVLDFYKELASKESGPAANTIDAVSQAESLLRATQYYEYEFGLIKSSRERKADAEFLYALKLCYELGLNRTIDIIEKLQKGVFGSSPPVAPLERLASWVYLSGQHYSIHDAIREAIRFDDPSRIKVMKHVADDFAGLAAGKESQTYQLAVFLGRNIQFVPRDDSHPFLPDQIYGYMKSKIHFERGVGLGSGESILSVDEQLQQEILKRAGVDIEFARGLGDSLGHNFQHLDEVKRKEILAMANSGLPFARYFGESLGREFRYLPKQIQGEIMALITENNQLADGLGMGIGSVFRFLPAEFQKEVFAKAEKNSEFTRGLGYGFGNNYGALDADFRGRIMALADVNSEFAFGLGMGFGNSFPYFPLDLQGDILARTEENSQLAYGLGIYTGYTFPYLPPELQARVFALSEGNGRFAHGLGIGIAYIFFYLPKELQGRILVKTAQSNQFALGLGNGFGLIFKHIPKESQQQFYAMGQRNIEFNCGLGIGIGFVIKYLDGEQKNEIMARASSDSGFARGLG